MAFIDAVQASLPKMTLTNLVTGARLTAQYNPATFKEEVGVNYAKIVIPGMSHQVKQFVHTEDEVFTLSMEFDAITWGLDGSDGVAKIKQARKQLIAWCHPRKGAGSIKTAGSPRVLFVWPNLVSLTCVITKVAFTYERFSASNLIGYKADVTIEEIRDSMVYSEDVEEQGTERY